jgi:hypothetical protein
MEKQVVVWVCCPCALCAGATPRQLPQLASMRHLLSRRPCIAVAATTGGGHNGPVAACGTGRRGALRTGVGAAHMGGMGG